MPNDSQFLRSFLPTSDSLSRRLEYLRSKHEKRPNQDLTRFGNQVRSSSCLLTHPFYYHRKLFGSSLDQLVLGNLRSDRVLTRQRVSKTPTSHKWLSKIRALVSGFFSFFPPLLCALELRTRVQNRCHRLLMSQARLKDRLVGADESIRCQIIRIN